jgi:phosphoribosylformylglycinamidine cyclo-ligase
MDYRSAGVDVEAGRAFVDRIRNSVEATHRPEVVGGLGGFGGICRLPAGMRKPLLVAGTDGVGTKLELAQDCGRHHGVGIDLVAMCANDVITCGAEPLFFLDYIATGKLSPDAMAEVVVGIAEGCSRSGCALLGGETAEMPGFYPAGRYDLAGFCVAVVEEDEIIDGKGVIPGDLLVAIASSGVHSNGFSLVRKVLRNKQIDLHGPQIALGGASAADALLTPTYLYAPLVKALRAAKLPVRAMAHITGGGLPENLPRCLPEGVRARVNIESWQRPALFSWLQELGEIPEANLWHTFNLGVGFVLVVPESAMVPCLELIANIGLDGWPLGQIEAGSPGVFGLPAGA